MFAWGEDLSGWLNEPTLDNYAISLVWLLVAHLSFLNMMISISGTVFSETSDEWESGDMEIKNELILYCERMSFWNHWKEDAHRKNIIYVEEDHERPDAEVTEQVDNILEHTS